MSGVTLKKSSRTKKNIKHKRYIKPAVITYPEEAILDLIGPANTAGSPVFHPHTVMVGDGVTAKDISNIIQA